MHAKMLTVDTEFIRDTALTYLRIYSTCMTALGRRLLSYSHYSRFTHYQHTATCLF